MWLVDMEDEQGMYQVLWSGEPLARNRRLLSTHEPVWIQGRIRKDRQGQLVLLGEAITKGQ